VRRRSDEGPSHKSKPSWNILDDGTIEVKGIGGFCQVKVAANSWGGAAIISVLSPEVEVTNFNKVEQAISHLKGRNISSQNLRRLHRELPNQLEAWRSKDRNFKAGAFVSRNSN